MLTEPHFPHPLPAAPTIGWVLTLLASPHADTDGYADQKVGEAFGFSSYQCGNYTTNLDHALGLIAQVLPGWSVDMQFGRILDERSREELGGSGPYLFVTVHEWLGGPTFRPLTPPNVGRTKALSACIALFETLKAFHATGRYPVGETPAA